MKKTLLLTFLLLTVFAACSSKPKQVKCPATDAPLQAPQFSGDSAMAYLQTQCDFGPRIPGTEAHKRCVDFITARLTAWDIPYDLQETNAKRYDGQTIPVRNITAHILPDADSRILLLAHYDCRPWADNDPEQSNWHTPVLGANDGASGVAVLLEVARQLSLTDSLTQGVDILFVDAEDAGLPQFEPGSDEDSWCLGTQLWAREQAQKGYKAQYGILLDMVGDPAASFPREYFSDQYASGIVSKVWSTAASLGFTQYFRDQPGGGITDDHLFINRILQIPCIDIIHHDPRTGSFPKTWHTINDTPDHCAPAPLTAVGQTLLYLVK